MKGKNQPLLHSHFSYVWNKGVLRTNCMIQTCAMKFKQVIQFTFFFKKTVGSQKTWAQNC